MTQKVVFDTNVYIAFLLGGPGAKRLLHLWRLKRFILYTSKVQIEELIGVVKFYFSSREGRQNIEQKHLSNLVFLLEKRAEFVANRRFGERSPDADDDWIIGIAIESRADILVTQNAADINQSMFRPNEAVQVLTIGAFLSSFED
jgi:putative PIN family toxin of toxin-antitoxin system